MAAVCPLNFNVDHLREQVRVTYDQVARNPNGAYHFHRGAEYAHSFLGYDAEELAALPALCSERFAGVGNPLAIGPVTPGMTVLDHACGAGTDLLLAARRVGPAGRAIGLDMTPAMVECATTAARQAGLDTVVEVHQGFYEELPVADASVDVLISNGVLNLSPDKPQVLGEAFRVLKPGGRLYLADVVVQRELTYAARSNPDLWAACIGGALVESELEALARAVGFSDGHVVQRFNCFYGTSAEAKVAKDLFIQSVNFFARKEGVS
jgi:ubiquinone/menaquinone biosynthesis C-methylase UbiE